MGGRAGPRLECASGRAPGRRAHGAGGRRGPAAPLPVPSLPPKAEPAEVPRPLPARSGRGGRGSGSWAGGGPPPASPEPEERPARLPPTQQRSQLAEPRDPRFTGGPGGRCVRAREEARGGPHAPPAAPCP